MGCCNSTSLSNELYQTIDEYISSLSLSTNVKERIKTEISQKVESSLDNDEQIFIKLNWEEQSLFIQNRKNAKHFAIRHDSKSASLVACFIFPNGF